MKSNRWQPVLGYEESYQVSSNGNIRSIDRFINNRKFFGKNLRGIILPDGYVRVNLKRHQMGKLSTVHRIVAKAFIPNPQNKPQVNHIDGDKKNNSVSNLEWCTISENMLHAERTGLRKGVHKNVRVNITNEDLIFIKANAHRSNNFIAKKYGIGNARVNKIKKGLGVA